MSGIRIVLTVTEANPELYAALKEVPARLRAERVRTLATLGLAAISSGIRPSVVPVSPDGSKHPAGAGSSQQQEQGQEPPKPKSRALSFAKSLGDEV